MKKEETKKKKKRKIRWQIKFILFIIFILLYASFIGTKGVFIKEFKISSNKINSNMNGFKILQFSDLHYKNTTSNRSVINLVKKINLTKPDIVIFTGDLIDKKYNLNNKEKDFLTNELKKINPEIGKYYILGDEDKKETISILNVSNFTNLELGKQIITPSLNSQILLTSKKDVEKIDSDENKDIFKVLTIHNPNKFDKDLQKLEFDVVLSGHTLLGQIYIPKINEYIIKGSYKKNYKVINNTKVYVNPGIGTKNINMRLFNHPTIYLYRLEGKEH